MRQLVKKASLGLAVIASLLVTSTALADTIYGSCRNKAGEKCAAIHRISTSWNGKTASFPSKGQYRRVCFFSRQSTAYGVPNTGGLGGGGGGGGRGPEYKTGIDNNGRDSVMVAAT